MGRPLFLVPLFTLLTHHLLTRPPTPTPYHRGNPRRGWGRHEVMRSQKESVSTFQRPK